MNQNKRPDIVELYDSGVSINFIIDCIMSDPYTRYDKLDKKEIQSHVESTIVEELKRRKESLK